jgi:hypothetical protein
MARKDKDPSGIESIETMAGPEPILIADIARPAAAPASYRILLDRPGVVAVGPYLAGREYAVPDEIPFEEAERLTARKGFRRIESTLSEK